jgi:hypothetical protein
MTVGDRPLLKALSGESGGYVERETKTAAPLMAAWVVASTILPVAPGLVVNRSGTQPEPNHPLINKNRIFSQEAVSCIKSFKRVTVTLDKPQAKASATIEAG